MQIVVVAEDLFRPEEEVGALFCVLVLVVAVMTLRIFGGLGEATLL